MTEDQHAFTLAVEPHRQELARHCARLTSSRADAEDALQETLLRAWRSRRSCASASPRAWLYRIATNVCCDVRAHRQPASLDEAPQLVAPGDQRPDEVVLAREMLLAVIEHLPPRQSTTLIMRDVLGWSAADVATALDTSVPATNSALQRARHRLRERLPSVE